MYGCGPPYTYVNLACIGTKFGSLKDAEIVAAISKICEPAHTYTLLAEIFDVHCI
jgi:hypothetical protein